MYYHQTLPQSDPGSVTYVSHLKDKFERDKEDKELDQSDSVVVSERLKKSIKDNGDVVFVALTPEQQQEELEREKARRERELDKIYVIHGSRIKDKKDAE